MDKLTEDFDILIEFRIILKNIPPPSYSYGIEIYVMMREMVTYEYPMASIWSNIAKFGKKLFFD